MLILYTTPPTLTSYVDSAGNTVEVQHIATDWQTAKDSNFTDIVFEDLGDTVNKLVKIYDDTDLDPEITYYSRSRIVYNTGLSDWSEINVIKLKESRDIDIISDLPTVVATPDISVNFDPSAAPATFFTINTSDMSCNSNAYHKASNWVIEDEYGNVFYNDIDNESDLTERFVNDLKLEEGKLYYIKVSHVASSNDVSPLGKYPIYVPKVPITVTSNTENVDVTQDVVVQLGPIDNFKQLDYTLYAVGLNIVDTITTGTSTTLSFTISSYNFINPAQLYMIKVIVTYDNDTTSDPKYIFMTGATTQPTDSDGNTTDTSDTAS